LAGNKPNSAAELEFWNTRIAPELGKDGVEWVGEVDDVKKNALLGRAAALIVPIQWDEPFGIVFAEALATGTPVITCSRGAAPEIIEPNRTGFFISDVESGAIAVRRLAEIDRRDCRREVEARFSSEVCADVYLNLYRQCIERTH
jgi:glycosyltransferase involved in cell wall biosynthesis